MHRYRRIKKTKYSVRKKLILANDNLFRQIIRIRDRVCQKTGKTTNLQVAHFWRRNILRTRWNMDNACLLQGGDMQYQATRIYADVLLRLADLPRTIKTPE